MSVLPLSRKWSPQVFFIPPRGPSAALDPPGGHLRVISTSQCSGLNFFRAHSTRLCTQHTRDFQQNFWKLGGGPTRSHATSFSVTPKACDGAGVTGRGAALVSALSDSDSVFAPPSISILRQEQATFPRRRTTLSRTLDTLEVLDTRVSSGHV